jgi:hypothetical protein
MGMTTAIDEKGYRSTESKYKSGAHEMCVTYDLEQKSHGSRIATYPKVKRVYIAGKLKDWKAGVRNKFGREVHRVRIAAARNVHLCSEDTELPAKYRSALQRVR